MFIIIIIIIIIIILKFVEWEVFMQKIQTTNFEGNSLRDLQ